MPTGTVDLVTMIFFFFDTEIISFMELKTKDKSTFKEPFLVGVPTQMNIISEELTARFRSVVKINLLAEKFFFD